MKPLCFAIAASIALTSVMLPVLQANAADATTGEHSAAWNEGYAAAIAGTFDGIPFKNPYDQQTDPLNNTDYLCGFIAGKSMRGR